MTAQLSAVAGELGIPAPDADDVALADATHDSRQVTSGSLFCAIPGARTDGHDHVATAVRKGAAAALVERRLGVAIPQLLVPDVRRATGPAAAVVHGHPSRELVVVGVTGTNGKTTTTYLLEAAFAAAGVGTGVIGTVETRILGEPEHGVHTTPEGTDLQRLLRRMVTRGVGAVAMEVSSHGLDLHRVDGTWFRVAAFTNLTHDHLDWHGSMEAYLSAKARLFQPELAERAVVFLEDDWSRRLLDRVAIPVTTVGRCAEADVRLVEESTGVDGGRATLVFPDRSLSISTRLPAAFNLDNAATAAVVAVVAGVPDEAVVTGIAACPGAPGRLERVDAGQSFTVFVDYAHTPDAVEQLLSTLRSGTAHRLLVLLGCGGDRDAEKRGPMGAAAALADVAVLTSDNPRSEDPLAILAAVLAGADQAVAAGAEAQIEVEPDRERAIRRILQLARPGDVVVLAGKGHERSQQFADRSEPFDDREVARRLLAGAP